MVTTAGGKVNPEGQKFCRQKYTATFLSFEMVSSSCYYQIHLKIVKN